MIRITKHEADFLKENSEQVIASNKKYYCIEREPTLLLLEQYREFIRVR